MTDYIPEVSTRVTVTISDEGIDNLINTLELDPTGTLFNELRDDLTDKKNQLKSAEDELASVLATNLSNIQRDEIINRGHFITGRMSGSVQVFPSNTGERIVGASAHSPVNNFPYPVVIEYGSKYYGGDPYVEDTVGELDNLVSGVVDDLLGGMF